MDITLCNINFSYSHKTVLKDLNVFFESSKIHALLGENGEGKSTTANIICGELQAQKGKLFLDNKEVCFKTPQDALKHHICYVHQRPLLCENISVKENLMLGLCKKQIKNIVPFSKKYLPTIKLNTPLFHITSDNRFFISLTNALLKEPKLLILDEPSALLCEEQIIFLYKTLKECTKNGMNIIIITHSQKEAILYCDDIFTLKNGKIETLKNKGKLDNRDGSFFDDEKSHLPLAPHSPTPPAPSISESHTFSQQLKLTWNNICCKTKNHIPLKNINLCVESGKITLVKGYAEQGLSLLEDIICAMNTFSCKGSLTITKNGESKTYNLSKKFRTRHLRYKTGLKIGIIPTNKKYRASNPELFIYEMLNFKQNCVSPKQIIEKSKIDILETEKAAALSGGMLQRLLINRELAQNPEVLILCNPLQGLDKQSVSNVIKKIKQLYKDGCAILVLSYSDFPDTECDNLYYLQKGEIFNV